MGRSSAWPKAFPPLSEEQQRISDDFMRHWHRVLPRRFGLIERFNHGYPVRRSGTSFRRTIELGAGLGEHLAYERLSDAQRSQYVAVDVRPAMLAGLCERFPQVQTLLGDCQQRLPFPDGWFDRVLAVHILEHLPDLPSAVSEMHRLCDKTEGFVCTVFPCEGGLTYGFARRISAQRVFEKRYRQSYRWFIEREHINRPLEIVREVSRLFTIVHRSFFPLPLPLFWPNLCVGMTLRPKV